MKNIIDLYDVEKSKIEKILNTAEDIQSNPKKYEKVLEGKILASLFFEPSTRTNFSFSTAMMRLGGNVIGFSDANSSSTAKGESLKDTIKTVSAYADVIVMRNSYEGSAKAGSLYTDKTLINAGDGGHLHPTQTLTDLYTIKKYHGKLNDFTIGLCGDLKHGRTIQSLIKSLSKYENIKFVLIAPKELELNDFMIDFFKKNQISYTKAVNLEENIADLDILYMTRVQKERFDDINIYERVKNVYVLDNKKLVNAKENLCILHPLPRVDEIAEEIDSDPRALYFQQVECGMYARMALFYHLFKEKSGKSSEKYTEGTEICENPRCITQVEKNLPKLGLKACGYCEREFKK